MNELQEHFARALAPEPPFQTDLTTSLDAAVRGGRRRRARAAAGKALALAACAVVVGGVALTFRPVGSSFPGTVAHPATNPSATVSQSPSACADACLPLDYHHGVPMVPADVPDYYLREFELRRYSAQGKLQDELLGAYGEHLPGPDTIHVQQARMHSIDEQGNSTRGNANRAVANRQNQNIELFDQVNVVYQRAPANDGVTPPPVVFESNYLKSTNRQEHISTNQPVKIVRGGDVITGSGMTYTDSTRTVEVQGRAHAVIQPRKR